MLHDSWNGPNQGEKVFPSVVGHQPCLGLGGSASLPTFPFLGLCSLKIPVSHAFTPPSLRQLLRKRSGETFSCPGYRNRFYIRPPWLLSTLCAAAMTMAALRVSVVIATVALFARLSRAEGTTSYNGLAVTPAMGWGKRLISCTHLVNRFY